MVIRIILNILIALLVFWYWSNSEPSKKDGLFYVFFISSQIGIFFAYEKIAKLKDQLKEQSSVEPVSTKDTK